ncbi:F-box/kelch-repeat protein At3g23880-like [Bidens hawaiensis]|uniref:F-box/kelch-repeat protein At3g23880-like n=1 Tax=Bidens hawaiensis TaxID=980011 RepID=UPI00404B4547
MAELAFDVVEQILLRMDVKDLIRCKSVCKSWLSFISTPCFVKAHLNHNIKRDRDNRQLGHRRICHSKYMPNGRWVRWNEIIVIVGSCNGLVCFSPRDVELVVTNPLTREQKKLPTPPYWPNMDRISIIRDLVCCWGFGYDSCADDYKVIVGFRNIFDINQTTLFVLTLKSNTWKVIGEIRYRNIRYKYKSGVLCGGALHWFMMDGKMKKVIISLDLSTEKFKEIPQPDTADYDCDIEDLQLGVLEDCLCVYLCCSPRSRDKKWVMKNNKWDPYIDHCRNKYDLVHFMPYALDSQKMCSSDDCTRVRPMGRKYISEYVFVKSLISPHYNDNDNYEGPLSNAKQGQGDTESVKSGNIRKRQSSWSKRSCKHKKISKWVRN